MGWDGSTERRSNPSDHDNLTRAINILESHVKNFDNHIIEDKENFKSIRDQVGKHAMYIYMALGAIGVIEFLFNAHK